MALRPDGGGILWRPLVTTPTSALPELIAEAQTTEEAFLRQIFVRDQMAEWSKQPLVMARADGVYYWDVAGKRYLDAISGIYVVSVGHNNRRVIEAIKDQLDLLTFSPPDARHQPPGRATGQPAGRAGARRPVDGQVRVRRRRGRRGRHQAGAAVPQAHRCARQIQDHQPLPVVARIDLGRALGRPASSRARPSTSRWRPALSTCFRRLATAARSARPIPPATSPARP